ncbi:MAG: EAL domain-containing protein [Pseudomonadota bacterium]|nr:EAL domain-containing protein [Pseudomonadota bacterium]
MFRFLVLPILAAIAAIVLAATAYYLMPAGLRLMQNPLTLFVIAGVGAIVLALASYIAALRLGLKLLQRTQGLSTFESDIRRRLAAIEADIADLAQAREAAPPPAAPAAANPVPGRTRPPRNEQGSDTVLPFEPGARARGAHPPQARLVGARLAQALEKNAIEAWFQPIVSLPGRKTRFFEAVAYLVEEPDEDEEEEEEGEAGEGRPEGGRAIEPAYAAAPEIDRRMLLQSLKLLRELDRGDKHAGVIWRLHEAALGDGHAFAGIERILDANAALGGRLIVRIEHRDWVSLDAAQTDRLHRLREMGFTLAIANCPDIAKVREAVRSSLFVMVILDVGRIIADAGSEQPIHRKIAGEDGRPEVEIVSSGVEDELQAMALIDRDVLLAQGAFFSGPRPMRRAAGSKGAITH